MGRKTENVLLPYALGTFGLQSIICFAASFQAEFYNKMYAPLDPGILGGCALVLFLSRLLSSALDPVIGVWIDRRGRSGARLYQLVRRNILPLALLTVLLFVYIPFDRFGGKWAMYAYITFTSVLWSVAMSMSEIPTQSMISYLTKNDAGCRRMAAVTNITKGVAQLAPSLLVTVIMLAVDALRGAGNTQDRTYYLINAAFITAMGAAFMWLLTRAKPEGARQTAVDIQQASATVEQMLGDLRKDRNVRMIFLINVLGFARAMSNAVLLQANGALIGQVTLFGKVFDTTTNATWLPYLFGNLSGGAALFLIPAINKRLKEKKTYILFSLLDFVFSMCAYGFYVSQGADSPLRYGNGAMYMIMTFSFIGSFLMGVNTFIPLAMTAETARAECVRTGKAYTSGPYAVLTMSVKLGTALSVFVGLLIVSGAGYNQLVYAAGNIPASVQNTVMAAFMLIPGLSTLLSTVPAFFYRPVPDGGKTPAA